MDVTPSPLSVSPSSILFHCCFTTQTKSRPEDKIKTALKKHGVWQYLEQWKEAKKKRKIDPNPTIKINVREFNARQGMVEQRLLGGTVCIQL